MTTIDEYVDANVRIATANAGLRRDVEILREEAQQIPKLIAERNKLASELERMKLAFPEGYPQRINEALILAVEILIENHIEQPPDRNCSCHVSPPCSDCVDNSLLREDLERIADVIKAADVQVKGGQA